MTDNRQHQIRLEDNSDRPMSDTENKENIQEGQEGQEAQEAPQKSEGT
jgi:hypothetical protein